MSNFMYSAIYQTTLIKAAPQKVVLDPVKIEFFKGPRSLFIPAQKDFVFPIDLYPTHTFPLLPNIKLSLPNGPYISITVRVKRTEESSSGISMQFCKAQLDSTIAQMASVYGPALFAQQIYRGRVLENNEQINEGMFWPTESVSISEGLSGELFAMRKAIEIDQDLHDRYLLMARFLTKSIQVQPSEEKFLYLWTILEIYPMKDATNIKPISNYLSPIIGKDPELIRERLEIGKLFGARSNLVHNGTLGIPPKDFVNTLMRLESICLVILRSILGLPYSGALDKYFSSQ